MAKHTRKVCSLGFSPDGEMLVFGADDAVRVWDARTASEKWRSKAGPSQAR